jgi:hypothetical protein
VSPQRTLPLATSPYLGLNVLTQRSDPLTADEIDDIDKAGAKGAPQAYQVRPAARVALFVLLGLGYYLMRHSLKA